MKYLSVKLSAVSPLTIRANQAPEATETAKYIPGTAFVGGLAATYRFLRSNQEDEFKRLFLNEKVFYPNLYPAVFTSKGRNEKYGEIRGLQGSNFPVYPLPKTAQSCKRHAGFLFHKTRDNLTPVDKDNDAHGVRDSLIERALFALGSSQKYRLRDTDLLRVIRAHEHCGYRDPVRDRVCNEVIDHFPGYYRRDENAPWRLMASKVDGVTRLRTHTGIHRESGTVQDGVLYNRQVFGEGTQFWGMIKLPDDEKLLQQLHNFLEEIGREALVHIGTGRSRGMGKVAFSVEPVESTEDLLATFKDRLNTFNDLFHSQAREYGFSNLTGRFFFALTLHSPLILCDDLLRYRSSIDTEALWELLGHRTQEAEKRLDLQLVYQAAEVRRVSGWQELWGMPRTHEYAIEMGSVFLFSCASPPDEALYQALFELEEQGAGKRRAEGFGRLCISDQFHQEIERR